MCVLGSTQYINKIKYVFVLTELPAQGFNNKQRTLAIESFNQESKDPVASSTKKTTITMRNKTSNTVGGHTAKAGGHTAKAGGLTAKANAMK